MVRGGLWTPAQFAADLNQMLMAYAASPVRTAANSRVIADFWKDEAVQKLPYQRGRLLATIWDARLRTTPQHHDMNWVMLEMRRRASAGTDLHAAPLFEAVMREQGADVSGDVVGHIERGAPILLDENIFAPCGAVITRDVPEFSRGFDINATTANNNVISGVDPALPAYAAGLRNGMVLVGRDGGAIGDSQQEIVYLVRDGDVERTIRYMPQGHGRITLQQLVLDNDLTGDKLAQCARVISGA
jgi:predicted metalloprotease with PDZ domain